MDKQIVARRVSTKMAEAETGVEDAVMKISALLTELYEAKRELGLAGTVGAEETARVGRALALCQDAHAELVGTHHGLSVLGRLLHIPMKLAGWKPDQSAQASAGQKSTAA